MRLKFFIMLIVMLFLCGNVSGQEEGKQSTGGSQGGGDLRAKVQNPVGALISVPFKNTLDFGAPDGEVYVMNFQPVVPFTVDEWNLINRVIVPLIDVPGYVEGIPEIPSGSTGTGATGLGDINYSLFISPAEPGKVIMGVGPSITIPSATDDQLGTGKWSGGATFVALTQPKPWTLGVLLRQLWSFAGDSDRTDVNQFLMQPFINYNLSKGWFLISDMVMTANWDADSDNQWTIPVGGGAGRVFNIGKQPVNMRLEAYSNVVKPDNAPDWSMSFTIQLLFPK